MTPNRAREIIKQLIADEAEQGDIFFTDDDKQALDLAIKALEETGRWIPVSEKLPDDMQRVLIWFEYFRYGDFNRMYQTYDFGYVCDGKWSPFINGKTGWQDYRVIAWQPLPEPYEESEEKGEKQ